MAAGCAVGVQGEPGVVTLQGKRPAQLLLFSGTKICDPLLADGPFLMNDSRQVREAMVRYASGAMGRLDPRPQD